MTHPEERRRCWTLNYAEGAQFHMDVLPALPDAQRYQAQLRAKGFGILAADGDLSGHAIAITDNQRSDYAVISDDWLQSNPYGYAAWFRSRMRVRLTEAKRSFAERERISASVDEIPDYKVRTPLQQAIQLLKRHRDCMFAEDGEHKPISIIITTLAAHAYNEEASLSAPDAPTYTSRSPTGSLPTSKLVECLGSSRGPAPRRASACRTMPSASGPTAVSIS